MTVSTRRMLLAALPAFVVWPLWACHPNGDDVAPADRAAEAEAEAAANAEGRTVEFAIENEAATPEQLQKVAKYLETQAEVLQAKVRIEARSDDATTVAMELWGRDFPDDAALEAGLRAEFPFLKDAIISTRHVEEPDADDPFAGASTEELKNESPEEIKRKVIEKLQAQGVQGTINVDVIDHPDGRREVKVEVDEEKTTPEPGASDVAAKE